MESLGKLKSDFDLIIWDFDGTIVDLDINWKSLNIDLINLCIEHQLKFRNKKINELLEILKRNSLEAQAFKIISNYESRATYIYNPQNIDIIKFFIGKKQCILSDNLKKTIIKIIKVFFIFKSIALVLLIDYIIKVYYKTVCIIHSACSPDKTTAYVS